MIENYKEYLDKISLSIDKFFEGQKPYVFCKKGCSQCCESGEYPLSELEFNYLMLGYNALDKNQKHIIQKNIDKIKTEKMKHMELSNSKFLHECPFLIDKKCSVYNYRSLICRTYGLVSFYTDKNDKIFYSIPCCVDNGLNYSNVYDSETGGMSSEKWRQTGIEEEPVSFNLSLDFLRNNEDTSELDFGDEKPLINWF